MIVYCTERFLKNILELKKNNSYSGILEDVCDYFLDKSIAELHITRDIIQNSKGTYSLNKYRIMNSTMNKGKSGSYRCITVVLPLQNSIYLATIYPKTGSDGIDNLTVSACKEIAKYVQQSILGNQLKVLDIINRTIN